MIAAWMLCYLVVGVLLLVVAFAADVVCARLRLARRWAWMTVMFAMCVLPVFLRDVKPPVPLFIFSGQPPKGVMQPDADDAANIIGTATAAVDAPAIAFRVSDGTGNHVVLAPDSLFLSIDGGALLLWVAGTAVFGGLLLTAHRRMARARRGWTRAPDEISARVQSLTGATTRVWCSDDIGPAAFGVLTPQVVIPQWALTLDTTARELLLRHEASHVTARDPLLLRIALGSVVLLPWNLPLLLAYRRLHRAVEHDCDARVLASRTNARVYARLLLDTAERLSIAGGRRGWARAARWVPAPVPGIGTRPTELEARLRAMVHPVSTWQTRTRTLGAAILVVMGVLAACSVPSPERMRSDSIQNSATSRSGGGFRYRKPTPSNDRAPEVTKPALDSIVMLEQFVALMPRVQALQDSIIEVAARGAVPDAFSPRSTADAHIWMLLDHDYRVIRRTTGRQYYSMRVTNADGSESLVPVGSRTKPARLSWSNKNFLLAFPGLRLDQIGLWSTVDAKVGSKTVRIIWARFVGTDTPPATPDSVTPARLLRPYPWETKALTESADSQRARFERLAAPYAAALLAESPDQPPVLWLLLNNNGDELAHASGRDGLFAMRADGRFPKPSASNPASFMTPNKDLGIDCNAFAQKFPTVDNGAGANMCGMTRITFAGREMVVVFGIQTPRY